MKIAIVGYSGCGKSTLAKKLGHLLKIPVLYLDKIHWLPGWQERPDAEAKEIVKHFMDCNSQWVIDGNYSALLSERRLYEADIIIFMNFNRFSCLMRALRRYFKYRHQVRFSMSDGCPEKIDMEFVLWLLFHGRTKKYRNSYKQFQKRYSCKWICIRNQRQLNLFLNYAFKIMK